MSGEALSVLLFGGEGDRFGQAQGGGHWPHVVRTSFEVS
jgi:hypothetical protein